MYVWRFKQFVAWSGRKAIDDWRIRLSPPRRAIFDMFMDRIAKMDSWPSGICDPLKNHAGCWELRWTAEKVEHRVFGYYGVGKEFFMLVGCTHKGKVYDPPGAFEMLDERKTKIENGDGGLGDYTLWPTRRNEGQGVPPRDGERPDRG